MKAQAIYKTTQAARHMSALCNHFGRTEDASCSGKSGLVHFTNGRCELSATQDVLTLDVSAQTPSDLDDIIRTITSHLERFAFRENPDLDWYPAPPAQAADKTNPTKRSH